MSNKETEKKLSDLHNKLTDTLLERIRDPEVKASDLNVARKLSDVIRGKGDVKQ
jgi:hypothetical protein